ncbi:MAG TPA: hypothetical protein VFW44_09645 [Bryobacteraceae bacterium]|nr:hypothetical protein [Bryobacteraceae bacterium]
MDAHRPSKPGTAFEYFLYAAILAETALAALIYKVIFSSGELLHLRVYFAMFYFGFMAWVIAQLNGLHRKRKLSADDAAPAEATPAIARPIFGLTGQQLMTVLLVFATAVAAFTWLLRILN